MGHVSKPRLLLIVGEGITLECPCSHAGPPSLLLVSHKRTGGQDRAELVAVTRPMWGSSISAPASWDAFEPDHLQVQQPRSP